MYSNLTPLSVVDSSFSDNDGVDKLSTDTAVVAVAVVDSVDVLVVLVVVVVVDVSVPRTISLYSFTTPCRLTTTSSVVELSDDPGGVLEGTPEVDSSLEDSPKVESSLLIDSSTLVDFLTVVSSRVVGSSFARLDKSKFSTRLEDVDDVDVLGAVVEVLGEDVKVLEVKVEVRGGTSEDLPGEGREGDERDGEDWDGEERDGDGSVEGLDDSSSSSSYQ